MKKIYQAPVTKTVCLLQANHLMAVSIDPSKRNVAGGPTLNGIPSGVAEDVDASELIFGQNGNSIRSREADYWDDYDE